MIPAAFAVVRPALCVMIVLLALLSLATLAAVQWRGGDGRRSWRAQITSWWYLLPPVFFAWALHPDGVLLLVALISLLAARETIALARSAGAPRGLRASFLVVLALQAAAWSRRRRRGDAGDRLRPQDGDRLLPAVFAAQAAGLSCLLALPATGPAAQPSADWFLYLCIVTALNDIGQFLGGSLFGGHGRHRLAPRVSPNKTWEGAAGGLVVSVAVSLAVGGALGLAGPAWLAGAGAAICVAGLLGDLLFSAGKRAIGVKDYGRLIPGHGGILDRVDSLVLTAPTLLALLALA